MLPIRMRVAAAIGAWALLLAGTAHAQSNRLGVVDSERVFAVCRACVIAKTALEQQIVEIRAHETARKATLDATYAAIQADRSTAAGAESPAMAARMRAFETLQREYQEGAQRDPEVYQRNVEYVRTQLLGKMSLAIDAIAKRRALAVVLDKGAVLRVVEPSIEITEDVLRALDAQSFAVGTVAPAT